MPNITLRSGLKVPGKQAWCLDQEIKVTQKRVQLLDRQNPKSESQLGISRHVSQPLKAYSFSSGKTGTCMHMPQDLP